MNNKKHYLYHPSYSSFFCDNEQTEVGLRDKKLVVITQSIARHCHPSWCGGMKRDATYERNNRFWRQDEANYNARKAANFPL
jgi:ribosomal protein L31